MHGRAATLGYFHNILVNLYGRVAALGIFPNISVYSNQNIKNIWGRATALPNFGCRGSSRPNILGKGLAVVMFLVKRLWKG